MLSPRRSFKDTFSPAFGDLRTRAPSEQPNAEVDWPHWLRVIERKRRQAGRMLTTRSDKFPSREFLARATYSSFRLEQMDITETDVVQALVLSGTLRGMRSRQSQRIRNHVAILRQITSSLALGQTLRGSSVIRWYASISSGLCMTGLDTATLNRIDAVVRRINCPQLRLQAAITEINHLHYQLLSDSLFPAFNGILARLFLQYHLGRCSLPPVMLDPTLPPDTFTSEQRLIRPLLQAIDLAYDTLLAQR